MPSKEDIEVPFLRYFKCMKTHCKEVTKAAERDFKDLRTNKYKIKGTTVPHDVKEKIYDEQSRSSVGAKYSTCAAKECSPELGAMLSMYRKHCEMKYKETKNPYYKKVMERIDAVDLKDVKKTPVDRLFRAVFVD